MKRLLVFILFLTTIHLSYGQGGLASNPFPRSVLDMSIIDYGTIEFSYAYNATDLRDFSTYDDLQRLEIGEKYSKYYSDFVFTSDSLVTDYRLKNPNAGSLPIRMGVSGKDPKWSELYYSEYFKNFEKNTLIEYSRTPLREGGKFYYEENIPSFNWQVHKDTLTILGHLCQKATCYFRGRNFIAWFASDLPINNGPWKFGGLPGMILKVADTKNLFIFECVKISQSKKKYPIKTHNEYKTVYKKTNRLKAMYLQRDINLGTGAKSSSKTILKSWTAPNVDPVEVESMRKKLAARRKYESLELE